jgi:general secretion pathway protein A
MEDLGAVLLTGVFGCGKTLLLAYLENELSKQRMKFIRVTNPQGDRLDILRNIVRQIYSEQLPLRRSDLTPDALLEIFEQTIRDNMRDGIKTIIVVDEAHLIKNEEVFEQLRLFLNYQTDLGFEVNLILAGQPELKDKVAQFRHIEQRIALHAELSSLEPSEVENYIHHRVKVAGGKPEIFSSQSIDIIADKSAGIPRRINTICDLCLLQGMGMKKKNVDEEVVNSVVKSFLKDAPV